MHVSSKPRTRSPPARAPCIAMGYRRLQPLVEYKYGGPLQQHCATRHFALQPLLFEQRLLFRENEFLQNLLVFRGLFKPSHKFLHFNVIESFACETRFMFVLIQVGKFRPPVDRRMRPPTREKRSFQVECIAAER